MQAAAEALAFVTRIRGLGIGEAEMVAMLRRQAELLDAVGGDRPEDGPPPGPDDHRRE